MFTHDNIILCTHILIHYCSHKMCASIMYCCSGRQLRLLHVNNSVSIIWWKRGVVACSTATAEARMIDCLIMGVHYTHCPATPVVGRVGASKAGGPKSFLLTTSDCHPLSHPIKDGRVIDQRHLFRPFYWGTLGWCNDAWISWYL